MKTKLTILLILSSSFLAFSQSTTSKFDIRIGIGKKSAGVDDYFINTLENEVNYSLNQFFTIGAGLDIGYRNYFEARHGASFTQGFLNMFYSPFTNAKRFDFRVGTGLNYNRLTNYWRSGATWIDDVLESERYVFETNKYYGVNLIIENSYLITNNWLVGIKLLLIHNNNRDINAGIFIKTGIKI